MCRLCWYGFDRRTKCHTCNPSCVDHRAALGVLRDRLRQLRHRRRQRRRLLACGLVRREPPKHGCQHKRNFSQQMLTTNIRWRCFTPWSYTATLCTGSQIHLATLDNFASYLFSPSNFCRSGLSSSSANFFSGRPSKGDICSEQRLLNSRRSRSFSVEINRLRQGCQILAKSTSFLIGLNIIAHT